MPDETTDERPYHHGSLRLALLAAAESGLRERGADALTMRDLAREVGVSHAAPRRHFPDRQALLDALAEDGFDRLYDTVRDALAVAHEDFPSRLRAAMTAYVRFATENAALLELMYTSKHRPGATRIAKAAEAPFLLINEVMISGHEQGALQTGSPDRLGIFLFATLQGIASIINGGFVPPELLDELVDTAVEQFVVGARPLPLN